MTNPDSTAIQGENIKRGTIKVGLLTLASRVLGFVREVLTARLLGATFLADAFYVALRLPNLCRSILAEGAFTAAFVPLFNTSLSKSKEEAQSFLNSCAIVILLLATLTSILGIIFAREIVALFAPGLSPEAESLASTLTQIGFPFVVLITLTALLGSVLTSLKIYGTASWAQIFLNFTLILGAVVAFLFEQQSAAYILMISVVIGGIVGVLYQLPIVKREGFRVLTTLVPERKWVNKLFTLMAPALLSSGVYQISMFLTTILASCVGAGAVSILFYSDRVSQLPLGIFSVSLGTVLLPTLSEARAKGDHKTFGHHFTGALRGSIAVLLPVCAFMGIKSHEMVNLFFGGGAFTSEAARHTGDVLTIMSVGVFASGIQSILSRGFLASLNTKVPAIISLFSLVISLCVALMFLAPLGDEGSIVHILKEVQVSLPSLYPLFSLYGASAIAVGNVAGSISAVLAFGILARALKVPCEYKELFFSLLRIFVVVLIASVAIYYIQIPNNILNLAVSGVVYAVAIVILAKIIEAKEISETLRKIKR